MGFMDFLFPKKNEAPGAESTAFSPDSLARLLRGGRKIEAIKMVRLHSGAGLKEAKDFVDSFEESGLSWENAAHRYPSIASNLGKSSTPGLTPPGEQGRAPGFAHTPWDRLAPHLQNCFSARDRQELERLMRTDQKIASIKLVREKTNLGLKEAKDFIDSLEIGPPL